MRSHADNARVLYGNTEKPKAAESPPVTGRSAAAQVLYRSGTSGGSLDTALSSAFGRLRAGITDNERLAQIDAQRLHVGKLLRERNVDPADAHKMLSIYTEHKLHKRSDEALAKRWEGPAGYEEVRREAGSDAEASARLASTDRVLAALKKVSPAFTRDLIESGASQHPEFIKTAAKVAAIPPVTK